MDIASQIKIAEMKYQFRQEIKDLKADELLDLARDLTVMQMKLILEKYPINTRKQILALLTDECFTEWSESE